MSRLPHRLCKTLVMECRTKSPLYHFSAVLPMEQGRRALFFSAYADSPSPRSKKNAPSVLTPRLSSFINQPYPWCPGPIRQLGARHCGGAYDLAVETPIIASYARPWRTTGPCAQHPAATGSEKMSSGAKEGFFLHKKFINLTIGSFQNCEEGKNMAAQTSRQNNAREYGGPRTRRRRLGPVRPRDTAPRSPGE